MTRTRPAPPRTSRRGTLRTRILLVAILLSGCGETVLRSGSEAEANRAAAALERAGIPAEVRSETRGRQAAYEIRVDGGDAARARSVLNAFGLPRPERAGLAAVSEGGGIVPSQVEERARIAGALARDVEQSIEAVDGVVEARVHVAFPLVEDPAFAPDATARPSRASVLVRHVGPTPPVGADDVRRLVAGAVDALDPAAVEVVFRSVDLPPSRDDGWESLGPFTVRSGSRGPLLGIIVGLLGVAAALAALLVWTRIARRRGPAGDGG